MKKCPYCSEEIQDEAVKCRHCKEMLTPMATKPKNLTWLWWTLGIFFLLVLTSLISSSINTSSKSANNTSVRYFEKVMSSSQAVNLTDKEKEAIYILFVGKYTSEKDFIERLASENRLIGEYSNDKETLGLCYEGRGDVYFFHRNFDQAFSDYMKSNTLFPTYLAYQGIGGIYYLKSDYERAIANYNKAYEILPLYQSSTNKNEPVPKSSFFDICNYRGIAYYSKGDYALAINSLTEAIECLHPYTNSAQLLKFPHYFRGRAYGYIGKHTQAISDYNKALEIEEQSNKLASKEGHPEDIDYTIRSLINQR